SRVPVIVQVLVLPSQVTPASVQVLASRLPDTAYAFCSGAVRRSKGLFEAIDAGMAAASNIIAKISD
ncbi:MAG: hypothetical protein ACREAO_04040, partial [Nitrososphaera sp.]